jgi:hypothetical protein
MKNLFFYLALILFIFILGANFAHMSVDIDHSTVKYQHDADVLSIFLLVSLFILWLTAIFTKKTK